MPEFNGHCLCGAVRFHITALDSLVFCHCRQCRKAQGAPFASNFPVAETHFHIQAGSDCIRAFRSSADKRRFFCGRCASPLYSKRDKSSVLRVRAGVVDGDVALVPSAHIFANDAPRWAAINDDLPRFVGVEPDRE